VVGMGPGFCEAGRAAARLGGRLVAGVDRAGGSGDPITLTMDNSAVNNRNPLDNLTLREKGVEYDLDILDPPFVVGWHPHTNNNERREKHD